LNLRKDRAGALSAPRKQVFAFGDEVFENEQLLQARIFTGDFLLTFFSWLRLSKDLASTIPHPILHGFLESFRSTAFG
jgi:hypothetical protein